MHGGRQHPLMEPHAPGHGLVLGLAEGACDVVQLGTVGRQVPQLNAPCLEFRPAFRNSPDVCVEALSRTTTRGRPSPWGRVCADGTVENAHHRVMDTAWGKDDNRIRTGHAGHNMAMPGASPTIRRDRIDPGRGIAHGRLATAWNKDPPYQLIGPGPNPFRCNGPAHGQGRAGHVHPTQPGPAQGQVRAPGTHRGTGRPRSRDAGACPRCHRPPATATPAGKRPGFPLMPIRCAADAWPCRRTGEKLLQPAGPRLPWPPTPAPVAPEATGAVSNPWGSGSTGLISVPGAGVERGRQSPNPHPGAKRGLPGRRGHPLPCPGWIRYRQGLQPDPGPGVAAVPKALDLEPAQPKHAQGPVPGRAGGPPPHGGRRPGPRGWSRPGPTRAGPRGPDPCAWRAEALCDRTRIPQMPRSTAGMQACGPSTRAVGCLFGKGNDMCLPAGGASGSPRAVSAGRPCRPGRTVPAVEAIRHGADGLWADMRTQVRGPGVHIPLHCIEPLAQLPVRQPLAVGAGLGEPGVPERVPRPVADHARKPAVRQAQRGLPVHRAGHRPQPHRVHDAQHGAAGGGNPHRQQGRGPKDRRTPADTAHTVVVEDLNTKAGTASAKGTGTEPGRNLKRQAGRHRSLPARGVGDPERKPDPKAGEPVKANPAPTSQTGSRCGHVRRIHRPLQTLFVCGLRVPGQRRPPWGVIWMPVRMGRSYGVRSGARGRGCRMARGRARGGSPRPVNRMGWKFRQTGVTLNTTEVSRCGTRPCSTWTTLSRRRPGSTGQTRANSPLPLPCRHPPSCSGHRDDRPYPCLYRTLFSH